MSKEIFGIVPPMVTPFDSHEELDEAALRADVDYLISEAKVHGLAVGGSTGEGHTLSIDELRQAIGTAVSAANSIGTDPDDRGSLAAQEKGVIERIARFRVEGHHRAIGAVAVQEHHHRFDGAGSRRAAFEVQFPAHRVPSLLVTTR